MTEETLTIEQAMERFGVNPEDVGMRYRGWYVIEKELGMLDEDLYYAGAEIGDLCVDSRDPGGGQFDVMAMQLPNFRGLAINSGDSTYATYIFRPLEQDTESGGAA